MIGLLEARCVLSRDVGAAYMDGLTKLTTIHMVLSRYHLTILAAAEIEVKGGYLTIQMQMVIPLRLRTEPYIMLRQAITVVLIAIY